MGVRKLVSLIQAEIKKILKKKSFLVVTIIFVMYAFLVSSLYKNMSSKKVDDYLIEIDSKKIKEVNNKLDLDNNEELIEYVENISLLELDDLRNKYVSNNQNYILDNFVYEKIIKKNEALYLSKDEKQYNLINEDILEDLNRVQNEDWQYFVNIKNEELEEAKDKSNLKDKERLEIRIILNNYRLENNVNYDYDNYLSEALMFIDTNLYEYLNLKNKATLSDEESDRYQYLSKELIKYEYILKNKQDINEEYNLKGLISNFAIEFGLFILVYVVLISGMIVSEEFNKGTIKYLLTKPYKRGTILLAKYLTVLLLLPIIILGMLAISFGIGGLVLGFDSLSVPIVLFHPVKEILVVQNVFLYCFKLIISILPMYVVLGTFAFFISTVSTSTSAAVTLTFALYLVGNVINQFYISYNLKFLAYFVSLHWDFSYKVQLTENIYNMKPLFSLGIIGIYLSVILCITFIYFKKKDVKNI